MKILRIHLCYDRGDKIILNKESDLARFDLSKVENFEIHAEMTREEFDRLRGMGQVVSAGGTSNWNNITVGPAQKSEEGES